MGCIPPVTKLVPQIYGRRRCGNYHYAEGVSEPLNVSLKLKQDLLGLR